MASDQPANTVPQNPDEFFESIGTKVESLAPAADAAPAAAAAATATAAPAHDEERRPVEEIESLCMNCGNNGVTRLLLTAIPYFRQVVIMSFSCDHCHTQNNEMQAAGTVQPRGTHHELRLTAPADLSRQVVKSDTATVKFIELDLEIPAGRGQLTNVEGLLSAAMDDLELGQEARREQVPDVYAKLADVVARGRCMLAGDAFPFRLYVDDPAGNSFIAPDLKDGVGRWEKREYLRTPEQNAALGLADSAPAAAAAAAADDDGDVVPSEVYSFPASCPGCMHPCTTHMKMVDIPHFKQVVIMSTVCDDCGYRSNDVKTGGEIPEHGEKITLSVRHASDLARDILKSETCALECPELRLQVNPGTLGGRFTTVEGLLAQVRSDLHSQIFEDAGPAPARDSLAADERAQWDAFFLGLDAAIAGERPFTLVLTDPLASSFVQPATDDPAADASIQREQYRRTDDDDEELGLRDMKTEGYEAPADDDAAAAGQRDEPDRAHDDDKAPEREAAAP